MMLPIARKGLCRALCRAATSSSPRLAPSDPLPPSSSTLYYSISPGVLASPWNTIQQRGAKCLGSDVRSGDVIRRKGRILEVVQARHNMHGRGGAAMQVELRDIGNGSKVNEKFRTNESLDIVFVEEKDCTYLYTDGNRIVLMEEDTNEEMEVSRDLFGKSAVYLTGDMPVTLKLYDGKALSASIPNRVTCKVVEPRGAMKGALLNSGSNDSGQSDQ